MTLNDIPVVILGACAVGLLYVIVESIFGIEGEKSVVTTVRDWMNNR